MIAVILSDLKLNKKCVNITDAAFQIAVPTLTSQIPARG